LSNPTRYIGVNGEFVFALPVTIPLAEATFATGVSIITYITGKAILETVGSASSTSDSVKDQCIDECYHLLERWQLPGSDRNQWDFQKCLNDCIETKESSFFSWLW